MLTFPTDKSDFSAPNGVTYAWDGTDGKWRVKAFRSIDDFIVQLQDQAPAADESKVGDLWFDTSDESLTLFVYTGGEWVPAAPPVSLDGINATIDAALIVQNDLLARVEAGEVVQTGVLDKHHNSSKQGRSPRRHRHRWQVVRRIPVQPPRRRLRHHQRRPPVNGRLER